MSRNDGPAEVSATGPAPPRRRSGLSPRSAREWLALHGQLAWQPEHASQAMRSGLAPARVAARLRRGATPSGRSGSRDPRGDLERTLSRLERLGARILPLPHADYPEALRPLVDAPPLLIARGSLAAFDPPAVAIVGARAATRLGRATAERLGRELAERGLVVVSGLARGIDAAAHRGALAVGGRTIAVLACGPDRIYPPEHRGLAEEIRERGLVLTELPLGTPPRALHFPLRNRLISGLAVGVIVVEARRRSGSLITVRHALDQGREVFVVPGSVEGPFCQGTNQLLREGARAVRDAADVLEDLGLAGAPSADALGPAAASTGRPPSPMPVPPTAAVSAAARRVLEVLREGSLERESLALRTQLEQGALARALIELELAGEVVEERDGRLHRVAP